MSAINKYRLFDLSEIVPEFDLTIRPYKTLKPVKAGDYLPGFNLKGEYAYWQHFFNGAETHGPGFLRKLLNKPLVISFYSPGWKQHGLEQLKQLNAVHNQVRAAGGNLLVITSERDSKLEKLVWENNLSLNFYFDHTHEIAQNCRIYSDTDPIWNKFSGIDTNVPLPATYILDTARQVVYDHLNLNLDEPFPAIPLITAVHEASLAVNLQKTA